MTTAQEAVAETLRQVLFGRDFRPAGELLESIKPEIAVAAPPGAPYSIATNVAHAEQWQRQWLHTLKGLPPFKIWGNVKDFPLVDADEWPAVSKRFVDGLIDALTIAESQPFHHHMRGDEAAIRKLNQIAVHGAYHIGQVVLLKRLLTGRTRVKAPG
jgi:hypothetical protein